MAGQRDRRLRVTQQLPLVTSVPVVPSVPFRCRLSVHPAYQSILKLIKSLGARQLAPSSTNSSFTNNTCKEEP